MSSTRSCWRHACATSCRLKSAPESSAGQADRTAASASRGPVLEYIQCELHLPQAQHHDTTLCIVSCAHCGILAQAPRWPSSRDPSHFCASRVVPARLNSTRGRYGARIQTAAMAPISLGDAARGGWRSPGGAARCAVDRRFRTCARCASHIRPRPDNSPLTSIFFRRYAWTEPRLSGGRSKARKDRGALR